MCISDRGILRDIESGALSLEGEYEDIHTFVELHLIERIGEVGKKLHTGRSRNDQIALDMRLYAREKAAELKELLLGLIAALKRTGEANPFIMPGYTHLQRAQAVTFRYYMDAYVSMLSRDVRRVENASDILNESPLG